MVPGRDSAGAAASFCSQRRHDDADALRAPGGVGGGVSAAGRDQTPQGRGAGGAGRRRLEVRGPKVTSGDSEQSVGPGEESRATYEVRRQWIPEGKRESREIL